eukprot:jgi/Mesvir1/788/Mv17386-RA.1
MVAMASQMVPTISLRSSSASLNCCPIVGSNQEASLKAACPSHIFQRCTRKRDSFRQTAGIGVWGTPLAPRGQRLSAPARPRNAVVMASAKDIKSRPEDTIVVGVGGIGIDYVATVDNYPRANDKIRSNDLKILGGGNVGNALTASARLGLRPAILSKVADDATGDSILKELEADGISTQHIKIGKGGTSPFTYIIVASVGNTRTCIHQPGTPALTPDEVSPADVDNLLQGAHMVFFDGRLPDTAIKVAQAAVAKGIPILVEAERPREGLDPLLSHADYCITSTEFPESWTKLPNLANSLTEMLHRLPKARFIVTTLGDRGCVMLERLPPGEKLPPRDAIDVLRDTMGAFAPPESGWVLEPAAAAGGKAFGAKEKGAAPAVAGTGLAKLPLKEAMAKGSSVRCSPSHLLTRPRDLLSDLAGSSQSPLNGRFWFASAVPVQDADIVDTTGAGDGFIGASIYALAMGLPYDKMLRLASTVAARNICALGARPGLPYRRDIDPELL